MVTGFLATFFTTKPRSIRLPRWSRSVTVPSAGFPAALFPTAPGGGRARRRSDFVL